MRLLGIEAAVRILFDENNERQLAFFAEAERRRIFIARFNPSKKEFLPNRPGNDMANTYLTPTLLKNHRQNHRYNSHKHMYRDRRRVDNRQKYIYRSPSSRYKRPGPRYRDHRLVDNIKDDGDRYFIFLVESGESGDKESGKVSSR